MRKKIKEVIVSELKETAGLKCANPGCPNRQTEIHHIKPWAQYKTHDKRHMIAICPSCHDSVHRGSLRITERAIRSWQSIKRSPKVKRAYLYVEPNYGPMIQLGEICYRCKEDEAYVINLSGDAYLKIRTVDQQHISVSTQLKDLSGNIVMVIVENHLELKKTDNIHFEYVAGHFRITTDDWTKFIPTWIYDKIKDEEPWVNNKEFTLLDIEVLKPGLIRLINYVSANGMFCLIASKFIHIGMLSDTAFVSYGAYGEGDKLPIIEQDSNTILLNDVLKNMKSRRGLL